MKRVFLCMFLLAPLAALSAPPGLALRDAWVRAMPPVADSTAAYFALVNRGGEAVVLRGARAEGARHAMLHGVAGDEGARRMVHLHSIKVPAGGEVVFAPGGRHLMLTDLDAVPAEGEAVNICLVLSTGELCHAFPVRRDKGN